MALLDIQEAAGQRRDSLGLSCLAIHLGVGGFVLIGWVLSSLDLLIFYILLLPAMAGQWAFNRRSCLINNLESWLRTGRWRDPENCEEGGC